MGPEDKSTGKFEPLPSTIPTGSANPFGSLVDQTVGNYRVLREIGRGGMGVVYEAEQQNPKRRVALKVINPGVASQSALRRFEHEAQILGRLQHPGIATIYEAGTFDLGAGAQPYFAMELIQGEPLTSYASRRNLNTRDRLELIAKICHAVQHAHQKGIVHRDLKPANILVIDESRESPGMAMPGLSPQPKILDFGVARATDRDIQTSSLREDIGQLIGTIPYMSPEQAGGDPNELDTRSDVYALGVVAYELLVDRLPYDLANRMIHEAVRVIREEEPTRLSSINRTLRGDVEIIIGRALEKEKERRYQTATDFASDIERYLRDEPIVARPPSAAYQLRRFASRNRALVGGLVATFSVLLGGLIGMSLLYAQTEVARADAVTAWGAEAHQRRIAEEREREAVAAKEAETRARAEADKIAEFQASQLADIETELMGMRIRRNLLDKRRGFLEGQGRTEDEVIAAIEEMESNLAGVNFTNVALDTLGENIFDRALSAIDEHFADQPLVKARLLQTVAETLIGLGMLDRATVPQTGAFEIRRRVLGDEHHDTLVALNNLGSLLQRRGRFAEAGPCFERVLEIRRRVLGNEHADTLLSINNLGTLLYQEGSLTQAMPYMVEAMEGRRRLLGNDDPQTLSSINNLGLMFQRLGRYEEAEQCYREALVGHRRVLGDEHPSTLQSFSNLAGLLGALGNYEEAERYDRIALDGRRRMLGDEHPFTLQSINNMGWILREQGNLTGAEVFWREAMETRRRVLGDEHPSTLISISNLGSLLREQGNLVEAERLGAETVDIAQRILSEGHWDLAMYLGHHARTLAIMERFGEAEERALRAHTIFNAVLGHEHDRTMDNVRSLLNLYERWHEAEPLSGYDIKAAEWRAKLPASPELSKPQAPSNEKMSNDTDD